MNLQMMMIDKINCDDHDLPSHPECDNHDVDELAISNIFMHYPHFNGMNEASQCGMMEVGHQSSNCFSQAIDDQQRCTPPFLR